MKQSTMASMITFIVITAPTIFLYLDHLEISSKYNTIEICKPIVKVEGCTNDFMMGKSCIITTSTGKRVDTVNFTAKNYCYIKSILKMKEIE